MLLSEVLALAGAPAERVHKLAYSPADIHVDSFLTNFSIDYKVPETLIADQVMPIIKVEKASNKYPVWKRRDANKIVDAKVSPRGLPAEVFLDVSSDSYKVEPFAERHAIPNDLLAQADAPLNLLGKGSRLVRGTLAKSREKRIADKIMNPANYAFVSAFTGPARWDVPGSATADPVSDILLNADRAAIRPNTLVMSKPVFTYLRKHQKVVSSIAGVGVGLAEARVASRAALEGLFEMKILVGDAKYLSSAEGAPETYDWVWGKGVAMLYIDPSTDLDQLTFGKTFRHEELVFETILDRMPGMKGLTWVKASHSDDEKIVAPDAGFYLDQVIS